MSETDLRAILYHDYRAMKLWLLRPQPDLEQSPWEPWYDKAFGFVVRAETEQEARELADEHGGDERRDMARFLETSRPDAWSNPVYSTCIELAVEGKAEMIIRDFKSA